MLIGISPKLENIETHGIHFCICFCFLIFLLDVFKDQSWTGSRGVLNVEASTILATTFEIGHGARSVGHGARWMKTLFGHSRISMTTSHIWGR